MNDDESMRRTAGVSYEPTTNTDIHDFIADYARDAIDAGVDPTEAIAGLEGALEELQQAQADGEFRAEPTRSEPADFGGGDSTGVQDL